MCEECYVDTSRVTPLRKAEACLKKHQDKQCLLMKPVFKVDQYNEYSHTQVRKLRDDEIVQYLHEKDIS